MNFNRDYISQHDLQKSISIITSISSLMASICIKHFTDNLFSSQLREIKQTITQPAVTCSKLTIETLELVSGVFIVNFEHISHLALMFLLLTLNMSMPTGY